MCIKGFQNILIVFLLLTEFSQLFMKHESVFYLLGEKATGGDAKLTHSFDSGWKSQSLHMVP